MARQIIKDYWTFEKRQSNPKSKKTYETEKRLSIAIAGDFATSYLQYFSLWRKK